MLKISKIYFSQRKLSRKMKHLGRIFKIILLVKMESSKLNNNYSIEIPMNLLFNYYTHTYSNKAWDSQRSPYVTLYIHVYV